MTIILLNLNELIVLKSSKSLIMMVAEMPFDFLDAEA